MKTYKLLFTGLGLIFCGFASAQQTDAVAENMLLYQRSVGGWPKAIGNVKVDYNKTLSAPERAETIEDASRNDATIDNDATYKEINYLVKAYKTTSNSAYLKATENGIRYLLKAQFANGGWPQFYPDSSLYRSDITYNDGAMINAMNILFNVAHREGGFDVVNPELVAPSAEAVKKGISCILKTQLTNNGKLTAWCQQYDKVTLQPVMARKFELVGLSAEESTGIIEFLLRIDNPTAEIKNAVKSAIEWFNQVKITGYSYQHIIDATQPSGKDAVLVQTAGSVIWARYYEMGTNKPFFSGRDSQKKYKLSEIENERRAGYAWYGTWPQRLIEKKYPAWAKKNGVAI